MPGRCEGGSGRAIGGRSAPPGFPSGRLKAENNAGRFRLWTLPRGGGREGLPSLGTSGRLTLCFLSEEKRLPKIDPSNKEAGLKFRSGVWGSSPLAGLGESKKSPASPATRTRNWAKSKGFVVGVLVAGDGVVVVLNVVGLVDDAFLVDDPNVSLTVNSGGRTGGGVVTLCLLIRMRPLLLVALVRDPTGM